MNFDAFDLHSKILDAVSARGYQQLTQVQSQVLPVAMEGKDIMACAQTGTGKTAAFALPLLNRLVKEYNFSAPCEAELEYQPKLRVLVLTPTRELAIQVADNITAYAQFLPFKTTAVYGGSNMNPQRKALQAGVDILVATPGRLFDHIGQFGLDLSNVTHLVVDEADRMLDMGFVRDIEKVKKLVAASHQTLFFSATYSEEVKKLAEKMLIAPEWINVATSTTASLITQEVYLVDTRRKAELLSELIGRNNWQQVLVFVSTRESAEHLHTELKLDGVKNAVFHGEKTQGARNRALEEFKSGKLRVMVATDVAARGLDIEALPLVINLELPFAAEDYVHRVGRTGRAGLAGHAISFVSPQDKSMLQEIELLIGQSLPCITMPGYEEGAPLPARYRDVVAKPVKEKSHNKRKYQDKNRTAKNAVGKSSFRGATSGKSTYGRSKDKAKK
ncbi:DEAD/DEAH box helicase [Shewanella sp. MBTL60-007]|uniref:DEAD/DEAH box helicase n=1 Tax=Shewanella sp. MBTL60-007 TaxID=2815911 RepID=UPI001C7F736B|nr:DEAD/DEAH box helicase [Shewanella sp. MBTL60-007]